MTLKECWEELMLVFEDLGAMLTRIGKLTVELQMLFWRGALWPVRKLFKI